MLGYWKQFVGLGTGFVDKYKYDPFFRTECNTIALQVLYSLILIVLVAISFGYLYRDLSNALISGIREGIENNNIVAAGPTIAEELEYIRTKSLTTIVSIAVLLTVLFGYIVARITLAPTRNALSAQKQFIGNIAHELRTPLSVIKTNTEVALMDNNLDSDMKETLDGTIEELDRISGIINNLVSLSVLVRPEHVEFTHVELGTVVEDVISKLDDLARTRRLELVVRKGDSNVVLGNAAALGQIVMNLVKNAIEHTTSGGRVTVTVESIAHHRVELAVQDTGEGIARADLFRIFEPFYRVEKSRNRARGGSGLGLSIVSELVKMHQGKIEVRSALGRGTTVLVTFPVHAHSKHGGNSRDDSQGFGQIAVDFSRRL